MNGIYYEHSIDCKAYVLKEEYDLNSREVHSQDDARNELTIARDKGWPLTLVHLEEAGKLSRGYYLCKGFQESEDHTYWGLGSTMMDLRVRLSKKFEHKGATLEGCWSVETKYMRVIGLVSKPCSCDIKSLLCGPCKCGAFESEQLAKGLTFNLATRIWE